MAATVPAGPLRFIQKNIKNKTSDVIFHHTHTHSLTLFYIILIGRTPHFDNTVISGTNRSPRRRQMLPTRNVIISYNIIYDTLFYNNPPRLKNFSRNLYGHTRPATKTEQQVVILFFYRYMVTYLYNTRVTLGRVQKSRVRNSSHNII